MPDGKQRFFCSSCRHTFSWSSLRHKYSRQFEWFRLWIVQGLTVQQLAQQSGYSSMTIRRIIHYWLARPPVDQLDATACESTRMVLDGTYLHHRHGIFASFDASWHRVIYGSYGVREGPTGLNTFCRVLLDHGISPKSATIDGNPSLFRALRTAWPRLIIQRCLVHIQRQGLSWCRVHPRRTDARELRTLFTRVLSIRTHKDKKQFLEAVDAWEQHYGSTFTQGHAIRGWVATDIQRARSMLLKALPYMFHYLDDPLIPHSTNIAEGYFSRMKKRYRQHQGIIIRQRESYFRWYFYLCQQ